MLFYSVELLTFAVGLYGGFSFGIRGFSVGGFYIKIKGLLNKLIKIS